MCEWGEEREMGGKKIDEFEKQQHKDSNQKVI